MITNYCCSTRPVPTEWEMFAEILKRLERIEEHLGIRDTTGFTQISLPPGGPELGPHTASR